MPNQPHNIELSNNNVFKLTPVLKESGQDEIKQWHILEFRRPDYQKTLRFI